MGQVTVVLDDDTEEALHVAARAAGMSHHKWLVDLIRGHVRSSQAPVDGAAILIAEDDPIFRELFCCLVETLGWHADTAENGAEALALLAERRYRLLLTDWQMPVMDGFQLVRAIRAGERRRGTSRLPVIAITSEEFRYDDNGFRELGIDDYLPKPLDAQALVEMIARWLGTAPGEHSSRTEAIGSQRRDEEIPVVPE